jgi:hypothetical protein
MVCHDQEPLRFSEHQRNTDVLSVFRHSIYDAFNFYDRCLLLHSEQRSSELDKFEQAGAIPVYYWSHALIALDWYRYAKHDQDLHNKNIKQLFLVYNRAWTGTREYRLKFTELIADQNLAAQCRMSFSPQDQDNHYRDHVFANQAFVVDRHDLEKQFKLNRSHSSASADYVNQDYRETAVEVVLETLFDDQRWHLTEKALRPIACGQPFLLAATPGSLEYLRSYGFRTFAPYIDETYDTVLDPLQRLQAIVAEMQRINQLDSNSQQQLITNLRTIADYNRKRFFSDEFFQQVVAEYQINLCNALQQAEQSHCASYYKTYHNYFSTCWSQQDYARLVEHVKNKTHDSTRVLRFI